MRDCGIAKFADANDYRFDITVLVESQKFRNSAISQFYFFSTGSPSFCHSLKPPRSATAFSIPFVLRLTTAPADVCSFGQEQYVTIVLFLGSSSRCCRISADGINFEPGM